MTYLRELFCEDIKFWNNILGLNCYVLFSFIVNKLEEVVHILRSKCVVVIEESFGQNQTLEAKHKQKKNVYPHLYRLALGFCVYTHTHTQTQYIDILFFFIYSHFQKLLPTQKQSIIFWESAILVGYYFITFLSMLTLIRYRSGLTMSVLFTEPETLWIQCTLGFLEWKVYHKKIYIFLNIAPDELFEPVRKYIFPP